MKILGRNDEEVNKGQKVTQVLRDRPERKYQIEANRMMAFSSMLKTRVIKSCEAGC